MDEDDQLYSKLFGEEAPLTTNKNSSQCETFEAYSRSDAEVERKALPNLEVSHDTSSKADVIVEAQINEQLEDDDEEFDIKLSEPDFDADEDFEVKLDGTPSNSQIQSTDSFQNKYVRVGHSHSATSTSSLSKSEVGCRPASVGHANSWPQNIPEYDPNDPGVLPSQVTAPGQRVRLPGQTRVTQDEYKEFLGLGHGDIFNLEIDCVIDAPWRVPGVDTAEFFNYDLTPSTWKEYCHLVKQFQQEFALQKKVQVYEKDPYNANHKAQSNISVQSGLDFNFKADYTVNAQGRGMLSQNYNHTGNFTPYQSNNTQESYDWQIRDPIYPKKRKQFDT